jgi:general secretion pathway protein F/type IV pilus assembly protein PilC
MPHFSFQALAAGGDRITGALDAPSRGEAYRQLEAQHLAPLEIVETAPAAQTESAGDGPLPRLSRSKLIFFTEELADLLEAGLPVQQALTVMAEKQQDASIRRASALARMHLRDGQTLATSFRQASPSFDDLYTHLIAAGEASGSLAGVLQRMAQSMAQMHELQRRFVQAMVYPAFMIGACVLLMAVFTLVLVPQLTGLLAKTGQQLPAVTRLLLRFSGFCTSNFWIIAGSIAAVFGLFRLLLASRAGREWWDGAKLRIPLIGAIVATRFYAGYTQGLGNLVTNGVPLLSSLKLLHRATPNLFFQRRLGQVIESLGAGDSLSAAMRRTGGFQPLVADIIAVGEQTGQLAKSLLKAGARYDKELDVRIKRLTSLISPVIIVFLAIVVTIVAYCIVTSIFSAVSGIRSQTG